MYEPLEYISQSFAKKFFYKFSEIAGCPRKNRYDKFVTTEAMNHGVYFETACIGGGRGGKQVLDLPRNKKGDKYAHHVYIDQQVEIFHKKAKEFKIDFIEGFNTQVPIYKNFKTDFGTFLLRGELDAFPVVFEFPEDNNITEFVGSRTVPAMVDLKMTENISSDYNSMYKPNTVGWGDFLNIDHIQARMYHYLIQDIDFELNDLHNPDNNLRELFSLSVQNLIKAHKVPFFYWVFDKKKDYDNDIFNVWYNQAAEAELIEMLRKTAAMEYQASKDGYWETVPNYKFCKSCKLECNDRITIQSV